MRNFLIALFLLPAVSFAGSQLGSLTVFGPTSLTTVTVSQTLSMTSPSALISGTGPSATITMTNGNFTNVSTTNLTTYISGTLLTSLVPIQIAVFNGNGSCTKIGTGYNFASCTRVSAGRYGVSPTNNFTDGNYAVTCSAQQRTAGDGFPQTGTINSTPSATTTGYVVATGTEAGGNGDNGRVSCVVYKN